MSAWTNVFFIDVKLIVETVSASLLFVLLLLNSIVGPPIKKIEKKIDLNYYQTTGENKKGKKSFLFCGISNFKKGKTNKL